MMILPTTEMGHRSLRIPLVGFGTAPLATAPAWGSGPPIPETQAVETLHFAFEQGINYFDTAPAYGAGLAEIRTGLFLRDIPRDQVVIATKVGFLVSEAGLQRDYSRDGVLHSLEASLRRLSTDHVDILHVHDADNNAQQVLDETFPTLAKLREQGVIRAIGAGMNQWQVPLYFIQHADFDCLMIAGRYTLLEQGALPLYDVCAERRLPVLAASIYNSGILAVGSRAATARYNHGMPPPEIIDKVAALEAICAEFGVPLHSAATQFPLGHPAVKTLVLGFQNPMEVRTSLNALAEPIPDDLWKRLHDNAFLDAKIPSPNRTYLS